MSTTATCAFRPCFDGKAYQCLLPAELLIKAQREDITLAFEPGGPLDSAGINISRAEWNDPYSIGQGYNNIKEWEFKPGCYYLVLFCASVSIPYIYAVQMHPAIEEGKDRDYFGLIGRRQYE